MASNGINLGKAYVQIVPSAQGISGSISSVLGGEVEGAGKIAGGKLSSAIGGALRTGAGLAAGAVAAGTAAVGAFAKEAVSSYAEYEQLIGGVEKLYGDAAGAVQSFADEAYKTSGMSANNYMETATSFSASLIGSLDGDVQKAAELTDVAMRAMSDNVNVFGSDMGAVTNAFQGFAKQNYTMLDNLKLGYGGTKQEMQRLIDDANEYRASMGLANDLTIDSFADVVQAIQSVQEKQNIAGTTAKEAMSTIEGSAAATKAAWENVITAIGRGEGISEAFHGLVGSIFGENEGEGLLNQIIPRIQTTMEGIATFIGEAGPLIAEKLPVLIESIMPALLDTGFALIDAIGSGIVNAIPVLVPIAVDVIMRLADSLMDNLPMILDTGIQAIVALGDGLADALPELVPKAVDAILTIVETLLNNIDLVIATGIKLLLGLAEGLINAIPELVTHIPEIVVAIVNALIQCLPMLVSAGFQLLGAIGQGILESIPALFNIGAQIVSGLWEGLKSAWGWLKDSVSGLFSGLIDGVKGIFGIHSPSRVFAQIGEYCVEGFDNAFEDFGQNAIADVRNVLGELDDVETKPINIAAKASVSQGGPLAMSNQAQNVSNSNVTLNVYGAQGQDINALADIIMRKLTVQTNRQAVIYG